MGINLGALAASSLTPGLFNGGRFETTFDINGTLAPAGTTNSLLYGYVSIVMPTPYIITSMMANFPNSSLPNYYLPISGNSYFFDTTNKYAIYIYQSGTGTGRQLAINIINWPITDTTGYTFVNYPINIIGNTYAFPFKDI